MPYLNLTLFVRVCSQSLSTLPAFWSSVEGWSVAVLQLERCHVIMCVCLGANCVYLWDHSLIVKSDWKDGCALSFPYHGLNEWPSVSRLCFAAPACDYSQDRTGTPDSDLQMRDENSVSVCMMSIFPATFTVPEKCRLTSHSAWSDRMIFLFTQVTVGWSLQVSRYPFYTDLKLKCITTSHPSPAMLAFPYTVAPLRPHPAFITTSEGGKLGQPFWPSKYYMCVTYI